MLKIAIVGNTLEQGKRMMKEIEDNECSPTVKYIGSKMANEFYCQDGTIYRVVSCSDNTRGHRFDQVIISDINITHSESWRDCILPRMAISCVPEEFKIQVYEDNQTIFEREYDSKWG